jgi:hypothetical protein
MARCTDLCTKYTKGYCALCEARAMADRFCWRWFKGGVFLDAWRVLQRGLSGNAAFWGSRSNGLHAQHDMRHEDSMWSPQAEIYALL